MGNELIFRCAGQFASAEIHRAESDGSMAFLLKQDSTKIHEEYAKVTRGNLELNLGD